MPDPCWGSNLGPSVQQSSTLPTAPSWLVYCFQLQVYQHLKPNVFQIYSRNEIFTTSKSAKFLFISSKTNRIFVKIQGIRKSFRCRQYSVKIRFQLRNNYTKKRNLLLLLIPGLVLEALIFLVDLGVLKLLSPSGDSKFSLLLTAWKKIKKKN